MDNSKTRFFPKQPLEERDLGRDKNAESQGDVGTHCTGPVEFLEVDDQHHTREDCDEDAIWQVDHIQQFETRKSVLKQPASGEGLDKRLSRCL